MRKQFIATPIYYVNDVPHIGHAYTTVAADVYARFLSQQGEASYLLTGTDEHGAKIARAALKESTRLPVGQGIKNQESSDSETIKKFTDVISQKFRQAWDDLNINYNQFFRTTNPKHEAIVKEVLLKIKEAGFIYPGQYEGLYCVSCEEYKKRN